MSWIAEDKVRGKQKLQDANGLNERDFICHTNIGNKQVLRDLFFVSFLLLFLPPFSLPLFSTTVLMCINRGWINNKW